MSFFYDLNKKLDSIRATPEVTHQQLNERNMSQHAKSVDEVSFGYGPPTPRGDQAGPMGNDPDVFNYKTPNMDRNLANPQSLDKIMGKEFAARFSADYPPLGDAGGQTKYVDRTAPGVINKIKDKMGWDMPDPAYGPRPDERERLAKRYPAPGKSVDEDFGSGPHGPRGNQAGPMGNDPDVFNYKTPNMDRNEADPRSLDKIMGKEFAARFSADLPQLRDMRGQTKYVDRTAPGVINKIKDKMGLDMPDPAYGPKPDERERLAKRYPAPAKSVDEDMYNQGGVYKDLEIEPKRPQDAERGMTRGTRPKSNKSDQIFPTMRLPSDEKFPPMRLPKGDERVFPPMRLPTDENLIPVPAKPKSTVDKQIDKAKTPPPTRPNPAPKGEFMGTIKGGVWTADPPKRGEKGVPVPKNHERVPEAGAPMTAKRKFTFADKIANAKKEVDEMLGDVAAEAMRTALSPKQKKIDMNKNGKLDANDFAMLRKGAKPEMAEDQPTHFEVHYKDNQKGRTAKTKVKGSNAKQAKAAWNDWNSSNTPGRFTFVAVKPVATEMDEERSKGTAFDMSTRKVDTPKAGSTERGAKHDIKHSTSDPRYTGRTVTRRTDAQGISVGADDDSDTPAGPRGRGRPKGTKGAIGAKGPSGKSKLMTREGEVDIRDQGEYDQEGDMAKDDIKTIVRHAQALSRVLGDNDNLPEWVQSKLSKIEGMMISIDEYMQNQEDDGEEPIAEKAVSKKQQRFMGMVHSAQKGEKPASKAVGKVANTMKPKDTADFAKTKHKGLPEKKKKEVDENSEEGRLTTTRTGPGQTSTSSSTGRISATVDKGTVSVKPAKSGGMSYGKGIYDSINLELENMIAESMSINMSDSTDGNKSLTITATDEDAMKLAMMLKNAGLGGHGDDMHSSGEQACGTCGMPNCGCGDIDQAIDENAPDYPTNTLTSNNALQYAGGLNKPKTDVAGDGQTTIPNTAVHTQEEDALRRMMEMAGLAEAAKPDFLDINKNGNKEESMKDAADDMNEEDTVEESIRRMMEIAGIKEAKKQVDQNGDGKNDFEDIKIARMKASGAIDDKEEKKVDESIFALTNQWQAYKG